MLSELAPVPGLLSPAVFAAIIPAGSCAELKQVYIIVHISYIIVVCGRDPDHGAVIAPISCLWQNCYLEPPARQGIVSTPCFPDLQAHVAQSLLKLGAHVSGRLWRLANLISRRFGLPLH